MAKKDIQEDLVKLYLRLNGYFLSGLIIHSPIKGKNQTELDTLGIRFPFHSQPDRIVSCSEYLQIPENTIDIIIGEVKSGEQPNHFNKALKNDRDSIEKLINWLGVFDTNEKDVVIDQLENILANDQNNSSKKFKTIFSQGKTGNFSIRPIIFAIDRPAPRAEQMRYVYGQLMLDFIWECLRPKSIRNSCTTIYDLTNWGHSLQPIVAYFKQQTKDSVGSMQDFYRHFGFE